MSSPQPCNNPTGTNRLAAPSARSTQRCPFNYDPAGNRTSHTQTDGDTVNYSHDAAGQLVSDSTGVNYTYDGAGNLTGTSAGATYTYNPWGNLTEATLDGVTTTAAFDATGTRVSVDGVDQLWDRTGYGTLISTSDGDNFVHMPGGGVLRDDTDWLLRDAVGSVRHITNTTGTVTASTAFTAFGEPRATGTSTFGFAGEQTDPNTLIHLRARGYNPAQGTFTSYDPVQPGGPSTAGWNHYTYSANNPTTWTDPTGQTAITKSAVLTVTVPLQVALYIQLGKGIYDVLSWLLPWLWDQINNPADLPGPFSIPFAGNYTDGDDSSVTNDDNPVLEEGWIIPEGYHRDPNTGKVYHTATGKEVDPKTLKPLDGSEIELPAAPRRVTNANMKHATDQVQRERAGFTSREEARDAVQALGKRIERSGWPPGTIRDTHPNQVLVPIGDGGYAVYRMKNNGNAEFRTILKAR